MPSYDAKELEAKLATVTRSWSDELHDLLLELHGEEEGNALFGRYGEAFPAAYVDDFPARNAVYDIQRMEDLAERGGLNMNLYRPLEASPGTLRFKLFWADRPLPLSDAVPMLEDMGVEVVEERPYELHPPGNGPVWIHDFGVTYTGPEGDVDVGRVRDVFQDAFAAILRGEAESDGFNRLVLRARLTWRQIVVLRAYCKYLRQTRLTFSQEYMEQALASNPHIARWLVELFQARFDPTQPEGAEARAEELRELLAESIDQVANLDEDRILRSFLGVVEATLRTNYFQTGQDGQPKPYLSFKLDPSQVPSLPKPRPMFEVFVYSPRTEAVHLRGGPVARGGIRWSDRREDFRTEILGLMKAQMVKNAVIVPVGAKGGFVVKRPPAEGGREALMDEVVACYSTMMRGLLDITDNRVDGKVVAPADVVRYDDDDPYLVVAADKGTATFSDLANSIAQEYGFWLDDAFASGGSAGYDHKKMGITARGAWESVKQLFRETGIDTQSTDFTVVGIGDMSGDVFGNGMLLSRHIKLVGAFNHLHVFLDPDPDPETGFAERERLFALPRSSWSDYDTAKISEGGGVFPRSAKSIPLSEQVRAVLDVEAEALTPNELIHAMLKAPVDLLWNGGIGTYVKAAREAHADVGDRANDAVRVERGRAAGQGRRRGRQPRLHPARADRVRPARRPHQHRLHRQLRRGRLLRPRGQHQDPAQPGGRRRRHDPQAARQAAGRHDRRRGHRRAPGQLPPGAGDQRHRGPGAPAAGRARPAHAPPGAGQPARPAARVPAQQRGAGRAPGRRQGPDPARAGRAARLRQDRPPGGAGRLRRARGRVPGRRPGALHAAQAAGEVPPASSAGTRCAATSSPPTSPTAWSTGPGAPSPTGSGTRPGPARPTSPGPTRWPARCSTSAGSGRTWPPSTTWSRPRSSSSCRPRGAR